MSRRRVFQLLLLLLLTSLQPLYAANPWSDEIIYFVLVDRFFQGQPAASRSSSLDLNDPFGFHGGNLEGIIQKLDYLQNLGITTLWISPVFQNRPMPFFKQKPYHGYWPWDFFSVDRRFGDLPTLKRLSDELHKRGMKLLLDFVVNHAGYDAPMAKKLPDLFHSFGNIENWNDPVQCEQYRIFGLPDFASEKPIVQTFFKAVARFWIQEVHPDGFRLDAVRHVPVSFWATFNRWLKNTMGRGFLTLGELLEGDPRVVANVAARGNFSSLFDYPLYYTLLEVIARRGSCKQLAVRLGQDEKYPNSHMMATFLDNHDVDRFLTSCGGDRQKMRLALALVLTMRGIPTLCYGDEAGLIGAQEPSADNRRDMIFPAESSQDFQWVKKLVRLRKVSHFIRQGAQLHLMATDQLYSFSRVSQEGQGIGVLNLATSPIDLPVRIPLRVDIPEGTTLKDELGTARAIIQNGQLVFKPSPKSFSFFIWSAPTKRNQAMAFQETLKKIGKSSSISFCLQGCPAMPDQTVCFIGGLPKLGDWQPEMALPMAPQKNGNFEIHVTVPQDSVFEFKFLIRDGQKNIWQPAPNQYLDLIATSSTRFVSSW